MIHGQVEMDLVAGGAEFRRLLAHEGLQECPPVRLRIQPHQKIVYAPHRRIFARCQLVQLGVFEHEVALAHRALHLHDAVAHHARETRARFRAVHDLFDRRVEHPAEEQRRIVAPGAPLRRFHADGVLHVLDALAVPLIVERGEMVRGAVPLLVDVRVAALARLRLREILRGDVSVVQSLRGAGKKLSGWSVALSIHRGRWHCRIRYAVGVFPIDRPNPPRTRRNRDCKRQHCAEAQQPAREPASRGEPRDRQQDNSGTAEEDVKIKPCPQPVRRAKEDERHAQTGAEGHEEPAHSGQQALCGKESDKPWKELRCQNYAERRMEQDDRAIGDRCRG